MTAKEKLVDMVGQDLAEKWIKMVKDGLQSEEQASEPEPVEVKPI